MSMIIRKPTSVFKIVSVVRIIIHLFGKAVCIYNAEVLEGEFRKEDTMD
jgi:hypothetical protein